MCSQKDAPKNIAKFARKHLRMTACAGVGFLLNKVADLS